jgi:uncharacterized protein with von Willebrand factor type A (vWA) domain
VAPAPSYLLTNLLLFGRLLRHMGVQVHTGRLLDLVTALQVVDLSKREDVYHTCRTLLIHRHGDLALFDQAFEAFWRTSGAGAAAVSVSDERDGGGREESRYALEPLMLESDETADSGEPDREQGAWSESGSLAHKDFAEFSDEEIRGARSALARLVWTPAERRTRRWTPGRGSRLDLRRALARSPRTGGDLVVLPRRRRRLKPRALVLVCDVSGSMERYSRMLLHFAHAILERHGRVEVFLFSTRLTRVTRQLQTGGIDRAVSAVSRAVHDWSGGTRTGEALRTLNQQWSRRVLTGGPVVLLISDGWDRGDPVVLGEQVARLRRSCHRLIWLNPLIGTVGYAPLTRGLQAALPFVDDFLPARTFTNLSDLAVHLNTLAAPNRTPR